MAYEWKVETVSAEELEGTLNELEAAGFEIYSITQNGDGYRAKTVVTSRRSRGIVLQPCEIEPKHVARGDSFKVTYQWMASPTEHPFALCVHFVAAGTDDIVFQDDHHPEPPTTLWNGSIRYVREVLAPANVAPGSYELRGGLYDQANYAQPDKMHEPPPLNAPDLRVPKGHPRGYYIMGVVTIT